MKRKMKMDTTVTFAYLGVNLLLLSFITFPTVVLAGGKDYPIEGTVTALGTSQETKGEEAPPHLPSYIEPTP